MHASVAMSALEAASLFGVEGLQVEPLRPEGWDEMTWQQRQAYAMALMPTPTVSGELDHLTDAEALSRFVPRLPYGGYADEVRSGGGMIPEQRCAGKF